MSNEAKITVANLVCVTYQANSSVIPYHFIGKTEDEARAQMEAWLNKKPEVKTKDDEETTNEAPKTGRGLANTGKVWMISHEKKEKVRVLPEEVGKYFNMGYVKGGPRTQF